MSKDNALKIALWTIPVLFGLGSLYTTVLGSAAGVDDVETLTEGIESATEQLDAVKGSIIDPVMDQGLQILTDAEDFIQYGNGETREHREKQIQLLDGLMNMLDNILDSAK